MKWERSENRITISYPEGNLTLSFPENGGLRLQFSEKIPEDPWCDVLAGEPGALPCAAEEADGGLRLRCGELELQVGPKGGMELRKAGTLRWKTPEVPWSRQEGWTRFRFRCPGEDRIYGLGQDPAARLDHNHQERRMWNQWGGHERSGNCGIGFFLSTGGYGMVLATPAAARFCFNESEAQPLDTLGEAMVPSPWSDTAPQAPDTAMVEVRGGLDLFLLLGDLPELLGQYYGLTGLPRLLPKWAYGFLQCKNRYMNREDLLSVARRLRQEEIPCDGLIVDWLWFREFGDLEWREDDWPRPEEMLGQLRDLGYQVSSAQHPFISEEGKHYGEYLEKGYLNRVPPTKRITYDHTNPAAREHWWQRTAALYRQGLRGYWTDMGELEEHFDGTKSLAGGRDKTHNAYSLLWSQGLFEGQRRDFGTRPFILARSGCAGIQKYGTAMWSGDVNASWQVLRDQVVLNQTMALSGIPWWCTDIGGFLSGPECTPELYVRWMEFGLFCGVFRTHGTRPGNEAWSFGTEAKDRIRELIRLRYRLLPYIYSLAMDCALHGTPLVRPLAYAYPEDPQAPGCTGEFLFGPSLLAAPVTREGARTALVYLPEGTWVHWWSGKTYGTGWHRIPAPLGRIPLFARAGALIPTFGRIGVNAESCGELRLLTVAGGSGNFDYYDDEGLGFGYEAGNYTRVRFTHENGTVRAQTLRGSLPEYTVEPFAPQARAEISLDTAWQGDRAEITLTCLEPGTFRGHLEPEAGWNIVECTAGGPSKEIYETIYFPDWEGNFTLNEGDTVKWTLWGTSGMRRIGVQEAKLTLTREDGTSETLTAQWDGAFLSDPWILGCLPLGAGEQGFAPQEEPEAPEYEFGGRRYAWQRDPLFARNSYGYVDFRRFGPERQGEEMLGEAWAKEILYSKTGGEAKFELRYDSPVTLWLNGREIARGLERNCCGQRITLSLKPGRNVLILHQRADIPRPYSGGEFGYALSLVSPLKIWTVK